MTDRAGHAKSHIRCLLVEPHAIYGAGMRDLLEREPDIDVVAEARSPEEAVGLVAAGAPDVMVVDVNLPDPAAVAATQRLRREAPHAGVVLLTGDDEDELFHAVQAGASAHISDHAQPAELVDTIRRAAGGEDPLKDELIARPDLMERIVDGMREAILSDVPPPILTPRELEILIQVAAGATNPDISEKFGLSEQTVKNHLSMSFRKMGVPNRLRAVMYAKRQGWLELADEPDRRDETTPRG
jgi:NarL family two-component system response regulator LiaR